MKKTFMPFIKKGTAFLACFSLMMISIFGYASSSVFAYDKSTDASVQTKTDSIASVNLKDSLNESDDRFEKSSMDSINWKGIVQFVDSNGKILKTADFKVPTDSPVVLAADIEKEIPSGYKSVSSIADWVISNDEEIYVVEIEPDAEEWICKIDFVDESGKIIDYVPFALSNIEPTILAADIKEAVPSGYSSIDPISDISVSQNNSIYEIVVKKNEDSIIDWKVIVSYVDENDFEVGNAVFGVTNQNPVVMATDIEDHLPSGYVSVDPITDWTAINDGEVLKVLVKPLDEQDEEWLATVVYVDAKGNEISFMDYTVFNYDPIVFKEQIEADVPGGYQLVDPVSDWEVQFDGDLLEVKVKPVEEKWNATVTYIDEKGMTVGASSFVVSSIDSVVTAPLIENNLPEGYYLKEAMTDWTVTKDKDSLFVQVAKKIPPAVDWSVNIDFVLEDGSQISSSKLEVTDQNPVVLASQITSVLPDGYEPVSAIEDFTASKDGEHISIVIKPVKQPEILWAASVNFINDKNEVVGTSNFIVTNQKPLISADDINSALPEGYQATSTITDWIVLKDGDLLEVPVVLIKKPDTEMKASINYVDVKGTVISTASYTVTSQEPVISSEEIIKNLPEGYKAVNPVTDFKVEKDHDSIDILVEPIEVQWTVTVEYVNESGDTLSKAEFSISNLDPIVSAESILSKIPEGFKPLDKITDFTATKDGEVFKVVIQKEIVNWKASVQFVLEDGTVIKTSDYTVTNIDPVISASEIEKQIPEGYQAVDSIKSWTVSKNLEILSIRVKPIVKPSINWTGTVRFVDLEDNRIDQTVFKVNEKNPIVNASQISESIPEGYEPAEVITDWKLDKDGEVLNVKVKLIEQPAAALKVILHFVDLKGQEVSSSEVEVDKNNPMISASTIQSLIPDGYLPVEKLENLKVSKDKEEFTISIYKEPLKEQEKWEIEIDYIDIDTKEVVSKAEFEGARENPRVSLKQIQSTLPKGYHLAELGKDLIVSSSQVHDNKAVIQVMIKKNSNVISPDEENNEDLTHSDQDKNLESSNFASANTSSHSDIGLYFFLTLISIVLFTVIGALKRLHNRKNRS